MKTLAVLLVLLVGCGDFHDDTPLIRDQTKTIKQLTAKLNEVSESLGGCLDREREYATAKQKVDGANAIHFWTYPDGYGPVFSVNEAGPEGWSRMNRLKGKEAVAAMRKWLDANYPEETR